MAEITPFFATLLTGIYPPVNQQTASYTLALSDANALGVGVIEMNVASANTVTVPNDSTVNFPLKTQITVRYIGAGQTSILLASGVTARKSAVAVAVDPLEKFRVGVKADAALTAPRSPPAPLFLPAHSPPLIL